ncbi:hypothetical protein FBEOM_4938 [Fusarium beomiforme]|uniref:Uncharacterized protein n=1 Tax=Fusarium beomiforme TaxID=44412 RepID=A0A9P5E0D3_9HYPO|nr:hypothetical protein FBEOM_4938 [Fusarium beomiforme]
MPDSSPKTPNTPTDDQQGLHRSSRSTRGQLNQDHYLSQHYVVGEEAIRPTPRRRRILKQAVADDDEEELGSPVASSKAHRPKKQSSEDKPAELGSQEDAPVRSAVTGASWSDRRNNAPSSHPLPSRRHTARRRRSASLRRVASPLQDASRSMSDHQGQTAQQRAFQAEPQQMAPELAQNHPPFQTMPQERNLLVPEPMQSGQVSLCRQPQSQMQMSLSNAPGAFVHPADMLFKPEDLEIPEISAILSHGILHESQFGALYDAIETDRPELDERLRLHFQETAAPEATMDEEQAKAADAEADQEMTDALWDQFIDHDAFE